jgi:drug/metabolite transporter (DMT)-like permease
MTHHDNPVRGIALSLLASILFAVSDTTAKFLSNDVPVTMINWIRYVIFLGMALYLARAVPRLASRARRPGLQVIRAIAVLGSATLFIYGVQAMTIAQAITISFLSPLLITVLAIPMLGEHVGPRRWAAVIAGMLGVLLVVRPGLEGFHPAALFGIASATCWSVGMILTRRLNGIDAAETTVLWSAGIGLVSLTLMLPFDFAWPTATQWLLLLVLSAFVSLGQWFTILAHRFAPASLIAPFSYSQLIWVTMTGYLVFADWPDAWTLGGAAIIIASGLYIAHRERLAARANPA